MSVHQKFQPVEKNSPYHVPKILFWSHDTDDLIILSNIFIKNEKLLNSNNERSKH